MNSMTVGELITILQGFPQDAPVIYDCCSDYAAMRPDEVTLIRAEDQKIIWREQNGYSQYDPRWFMNDAEMDKFIDEELERINNNPHLARKYTKEDLVLYFPKRTPEQPRFVTVCHFPGN